MPSRSNQSKKQGAHSSIFRRCCALLAIMLLCLYISAFHFQLMLVQGASMEPTYHSWEFVLLDKHPQSFERGDVIAFRCAELQSVLIKRVAAVPGDTVDIQNGVFLVNGTPEPGAPETLPQGMPLPITLGEGEYFVLGDNRAKSKDSRYTAVGIVKKEDILGRVWPNKSMKI